MFDPTSIIDPRLDENFEARFLPLCDGGAPPPVGASERFERRKIEFLAVYYRLNQLYARLGQIRDGGSPADEQETLFAIQRAIKFRDLLEDFYQAEGFLGEPVMDNSSYKNIEFTYAKKREFYEPAVKSEFNFSLPMPPPGSDVEAWVREHLAQAFPQFLDGIIAAQKTPPATMDSPTKTQA